MPSTTTFATRAVLSLHALSSPSLQNHVWTNTKASRHAVGRTTAHTRRVAVGPRGARQARRSPCHNQGQHHTRRHANRSGISGDSMIRFKRGVCLTFFAQTRQVTACNTVSTRVIHKCGSTTFSPLASIFEHHTHILRTKDYIVLSRSKSAGHGFNVWVYA